MGHTILEMRTGKQHENVILSAVTVSSSCNQNHDNDEDEDEDHFHPAIPQLTQRNTERGVRLQEDTPGTR